MSIPARRHRRYAWLIGFKNTHNQPVYVNPEHVAYITTFEENLTIMPLAMTGADGKPVALYVHGDIDQAQHRPTATPSGRRPDVRGRRYARG
jgi:hypothetical protein